MNSLWLLYLLFVLMLFQLSYLMYKRDNQSIFVFAIIIFISYLVNSNMIFVLGLSLISINLLIYLRTSVVFEGIENPVSSDETISSDEKINCKDFKGIMIKNVNLSLDSSDNNIPDKALDFCMTMKKVYIKAENDYEIFDTYKKEFNKITDKKSIKWVNDNIYDSKKIEESYVICSPQNGGRNLPDRIKKELAELPGNKPISEFNQEQFENNIEDDKNDPNNISNVMKRLETNTPDLVDSLKILNTLDMNQVNSLINNLNSLAGTFKG
jgi:hypothetical protein